jgi:hypothetical protein
MVIGLHITRGMKTTDSATDANVKSKYSGASFGRWLAKGGARQQFLDPWPRIAQNF